MINIQSNYSLLQHNTFKVDVKASKFVEYYSEIELVDFIESDEIKELPRPFLHIGSGSNILFTKDFPGTIFHSRINSITITENTPLFVIVKVGAGCIWDEFVDLCISKGWYGVENLSSIPGEVGSAAVGNIGAYGVEIKDVLLKVETIDLQCQQHSFSCDECCYGYRQSIFKSPEMAEHFVTSVTFKLGKEKYFSLGYGNLSKELLPMLPSLVSDQEIDISGISLKDVRDTIIRIRASKLPDIKEIGSAGSFFVNPVIKRTKYLELASQYPQMPYYFLDEQNVKVPAGWLIEQCGWKGRSLGQAGVYEKQALVIVNYGDATPDELLLLSRSIIHDVNEKFGIEIHPEVRII